MPVAVASAISTQSGAGRQGVTQVSPQRLRDARVTAGLTQTQLAQALGYHSGQGPVGAWERGERRPDAPTLLRIARALAVDVLDLLEPGTVVTLEILRVRAGLTQAQVAVRLGTSRTGWATLEQGGRPLAATEAHAVAGALGCTAQDVRDAVAPPSGQPA